MVLFTDDFAPARSLRRRLRQRQFDVRVDTACDRVIEECAAPRQGQSGTWITRGIRRAYGDLHRQGYVHSVESWRDGQLVGGLYGVSLGRVFFGESMFARESDASKVALAYLVHLLKERGVPLIDCQQETEHLASLGAKAIPRARFAALLGELIHSLEPPGGWRPGVVAGEPK